MHELRHDTNSFTVDQHKKWDALRRDDDEYCLVTPRKTSRKKGRIPETWMLLDSKATTNVFCNRRLLRDIIQDKKGIKIHGHSGIRITHLKDKIPGIDDWIWLDEKGIANILSLAKLRRHFLITYDNWGQGSKFVVHKPNRKMVVFHEISNGLYYHHLRRDKCTTKLVRDPSVSLVTTIAENKQWFSTRQIARCRTSTPSLRYDWTTLQTRIPPHPQNQHD